MKKIRYIALFLLLLMGTTGMLMAQNADSTAVAASSEQNQTEDISVNELVFGHIGDAMNGILLHLAILLSVFRCRLSYIAVRDGMFSLLLVWKKENMKDCI